MEYERSVKEWIELLSSAQQNPHARQSAAVALGRLGDRSAVRYLARALRRDVDFQVRMAAARALGELGDPSALNSLIDTLLIDESINVRVLAAWALGHIGDRRAVSALLTVLRMKPTPYYPPISPAWLRGRVRDPTWSRAGGRTRHERDLLTFRRSQEVDLSWLRRNVAKALGKLGDRRVIIHLTRVMRNDESTAVRMGAATALKEFLPELDARTRQDIQDLVPDRIPAETESVRVSPAAETEVKPSPKALTVKTKLRCPSCQKIVRKREDLCSKCGKVLSRCMVCQKVIGPDDDTTQCPHCLGLAHRDHLEQWLQIKALCPYCKKSLQPHSLN